jgi:signal transduction histidine kinase
MQLRVFSQAPGDAVQLRGRIHDLYAQMTELGTDVQALSHRLHSSKLEYIGIVKAAESFCEETSTQHGVEIGFSHENVPGNIPHPTAIGLFRVLQEALKNAVKHSGARRFSVALRGSPSEISLEVIDYGIGFDHIAAMKSHGLGLVSMQERVNLISGRLLIESRPGAGTTIRVRAPVTEAVGPAYSPPVLAARKM